MPKPTYVYYLADPQRKVYIDVTKEIDVAILRDRESSGQDLRLVAMEEFPSMLDATERHREVKELNEAEVILIVNAKNPGWLDLLAPRALPDWGSPGSDSGDSEGVGSPIPKGPDPNLKGGNAIQLPEPTA